MAIIKEIAEQTLKTFCFPELQINLITVFNGDYNLVIKHSIYLSSRWHPYFRYPSIIFEAAENGRKMFAVISGLIIS